MKVGLVCFDFTRRNLPLQPWRYIYEVASRMALRGMDVEVISDRPEGYTKSDDVCGIHITYVRRFHPLSRNEDLMKLIQEMSPDILFLSMGPTSIYFMHLLRECRMPVVGMWTGTIYDLRYILGLGMGEFCRNYGSLYLHAISSVMPKRAVRHLLGSPNLKRIVVLNESSKRKVKGYGFPESAISVIPPGITAEDLIMPEFDEVKELKNRLNIDDRDFVVLYLGSPLTLRGTDVLIDASSRAHKSIFSLKLLLLSRHLKRDDSSVCDPPSKQGSFNPSATEMLHDISSGCDHLTRDEMHIERLIKAKGIDNFVKVLPGFLAKSDLKRLICLSDVVALPFKLLQSDAPISILEAMALGRPVISTKIGGIPEMLGGGRGLLVAPNDPEDLSDAIISLYENPDLRKVMGARARAYMLRYCDWDDVAEKTIRAIKEITD